ncbi:hypothetical protein K070079E91_32100 [Eisenbergiella porci]
MWCRSFKAGVLYGKIAVANNNNLTYGAVIFLRHHIAALGEKGYTVCDYQVLG